MARAFAASLLYCRRRGLRPRPGPSGNTAGERKEDALGERGGPWCHVLAISGLLTAATRSLPPSLVPEGGVWSAASACQRRPGPSGSNGQDYKTKNELEGRRTQGGEQRARGRRRHRAPNLAIGAAGARCKGRSSRSSPPTHPGATARRQRGVFPSGFPPHVEDFGPPHCLLVIEPTAGGQHRQPRHSRES